MALADELELQGVADELIAEFGRTVQLVPPGTTQADPAQPWKGVTAPGTPVDVKAVFRPLRQELVPGTAVAVGDSLAIVASKNLTGEITTAHRLVDGTSQWAIVAPVESRPGNTGFVWMLQVREAGA